MTHNQIKFGKGKRFLKVKPVEVEYESGSASRRAVLLSSNDVDLMAEKSSRARLINHLVSKSDDQATTREFASYYRGSTRHIEPPYSITSHTNRVYIPQALQVIPTYQSLIRTPQWCPYTRQTGQNSKSDLAMNRKYNCRCDECLSAECPARSNSMFRPRRIKDNIMTFCDQYTMTRSLNDAGCGSTPSLSTHNCTRVSVPCGTSKNGGKNQGKLSIYETSNQLGTCTRVPSMKKGYTVDPVNNVCSKKKCQERHNKIKTPKSMSIECFFRKKEDDRTDCKSSRKNIYNEGIRDKALKFPSSTKRRSWSPAASVRAFSRVTLSSKYSDSDDNIPHSHRYQSKYHKYCAPSQILPPRQFVLDDGVGSRAPSRHRVLTSSPRIIPRKTHSGKQSRQHQRIIKLPKKLLTSEKLSDSSARKPKAS